MSKSAFDAPRGTYFHFRTDDFHIVRDPKHYLYDPREKDPLDPLMIDNIVAVGVLEPVLVIRHEDLPEEHHVDGLAPRAPILIDGIQRVQHCEAANKRILKNGGVQYQVRAIQVSWDDVKDIWAIKVSANFRRDESMLQKGRKASILMGRCGYSLEEAATYFAKDKVTVQMWIDLQNGSKEVIAAVEEGRISPTAAAKLSSLDKKEQTEELTKLLSSGEKPTVGAAKRAVKSKKTGKLVSKEPAKGLLKKIHKEFAEEPTPMPVAYGFLRGIAFALGEDDYQNLDDMGVMAKLDEITQGKPKEKGLKKSPQNKNKPSKKAA